MDNSISTNSGAAMAVKKMLMSHKLTKREQAIASNMYMLCLEQLKEIHHQSNTSIQSDSVSQTASVADNCTSIRQKIKSTGSTSSSKYRASMIKLTSIDSMPKT